MAYSDEVKRYYAFRDDVYDEAARYLGKGPEELRQPVKARYRELFKDRNVLEVACGSGYWTRVLGEAAASVLAVDINSEIIKRAVERCRDLPGVRFQIADAFSLEGVAGSYDGAVAIWWYSHIPKRRIHYFLTALNGRLKPGAVVLFIDQLPYEGIELIIDENGDTMEMHGVPDGQKFGVIKNFPTESEIRAALEEFAGEIIYTARPEGGNWEVVWRTKASRR